MEKRSRGRSPSGWGGPHSWVLAYVRRLWQERWQVQQGQRKCITCPQNCQLTLSTLWQRDTGAQNVFLAGRQDTRTSSSTGSTEMAPTSYVTVDEVIPEIFDIPVFDATSEGEKGSSEMCFVCLPQRKSVKDITLSKPNEKITLKCWDKFTDRIKTTLRSQVNFKRHRKVDSVDNASPNAGKWIVQSQNVLDPSSKNESADICFVSSGTIGVVDLGASQTVMGDQQLKELLQNLPASVRSRVRRARRVT